MIIIQKKNFNPNFEVKKISNKDKNIGAIVSFVGLVRKKTKTKSLISMKIEQYSKMLKKEIAKIEKKARHRWKLTDVIIIHRYGALKPGDKIVFVATASQHRKEAFQSCEFIIDWLKVKAPIWKEERMTNNKLWVKSRKSDVQKITEWETG
jgi:molybdopterin synthase catalytic subunit|tara:strand:+ start:394 stop:846 length:453 start_codon:yes stop_codon:yes gene_type:complete